MEEMGAEELTELGASDAKPVYRGIYFTANKETIYRINYCSRLVSRVLAPLLTFHSHTTDYLYRRAQTIPWSDIFHGASKLCHFRPCHHSQIKHSQYAALCLKDAIVDHFRQRFNKRPNVDTENPDVWLSLHVG